MPDDFLNEREAAELLGRSRFTLRDWRERGVGPPYSKVVGSIVYSKKDLDSFLESCRVEPKAAKEATTE